MNFEEQYMAQLEILLESGTRDFNKRTGIGVLRMPHVRFQVDLSEGLPVLKSKKLFTKSATDEIMWIMQKQSNKREDINSSIWDKWVNEEGTIGKAYGYQVYPEVPVKKPIKVRSKRVPFDNVEVSKEYIEEQVSKANSAIEQGIYGNKDSEEYKQTLLIIDMWKSMMYSSYVFEFKDSTFVSEPWRNIFTFINQFKYIEGYTKLKRACINMKDWGLSREYYDTNCYALDTIVLAPPSVCVQWGKDLDKLRSSHDEELEFTRNMIEINQVSQVIRGILTDPSSRRLMICLWNIYDLCDMELEPCCFNSDFTVINGVLHCSVSQRSGDSLVGVPFNMYQYAVLTHAIANATGLKVGLLTLDIADFHVYENQLEGAKLQMKRWKILERYSKLIVDVHKEGYIASLNNCANELCETGATVTSSDVEDLFMFKPFLNLPKGKNFYNLTLNDLQIVAYNSLPKIEYAVAK